MLKLFLRKILIKALQPFGFYITYYASANRVFDALKDQSLDIQEFELKRIFDAVAIAKNHKYYTALIANFIPDWEVTIKDATFIGFGAGASSLSTFRKVNTETQNLHEKVYFTAHPDLERIKWLYQDFSSLIINSGIALPNIYSIYSGAVITTVYSEFVVLNKLDSSFKKTSLLKFSKQLYQLSLSDEFEQKKQTAPQKFKDFKNHFEYKRSRLAARNALKQHGLNLETLEQRVMQSRYVLTHGDIQETNAFKDNVLIDWDSVGIYPAGLDPAFLLFYLMQYDIAEQFDVTNWINEHYRAAIVEEEWESFKFNFKFFIFVFIQNLGKDGFYSHLPVMLINELKKLH